MHQKTYTPEQQKQIEKMAQGLLAFLCLTVFLPFYIVYRIIKYFVNKKK